jgi:hypothetical protein
MTSVYIITGFILLSCATIGFISIKQSIAKRKRERARLLNALKKRSKELLQMLNAFPPDFLPKEISAFLYRCIVDVFEQLSKLEPKQPEFLKQLMLYTAKMETTIRQPINTHKAHLQSTTQINEIRQYLNYLSRFMQSRVKRGSLSNQQYATYKLILKNLVTKLMIDNYILSATKSLNIGDNKLAVHYLTLAKDIIIKEGLANTQKDSIAHINTELMKLHKLLKIENETASKVQMDTQAKAEGDKWNTFESNDDWKKKNIYD